MEGRRGGAAAPPRRAYGLGWDDLGLGRRHLGRGLALGALTVALVAVVSLVGIALPATRTAFEDTRAAGTVGALLHAAPVRFPFGTVLLEEIAFRGGAARARRRRLVAAHAGRVGAVRALAHRPVTGPERRGCSPGS
ncbi:hypothetical protein LWC35_32360 [Pseudonocardia kujensis]|uniref:hypothetical protein n=1 Tax=Pseudonocardia kujensis TaxID=1128675 RepID=UPI001E49E95E|nr:hypothetical protein [Pseudonocardia kujensis]MCE0767557.1 hypothetical protein [Pseudonocardia kujensis]